MTINIHFIVDFVATLSYNELVKSDGASLPLFAPAGCTVGGDFLRTTLRMLP
jgi:hypothetical protein